MSPSVSSSCTRAKPICVPRMNLTSDSIVYGEVQTSLGLAHLRFNGFSDTDFMGNIISWKYSPDGQSRSAKSQDADWEQPLSEVPAGDEKNLINTHIVNLSVWFLPPSKAIDACLPPHHTYMTLLMPSQLNRMEAP